MVRKHDGVACCSQLAMLVAVFLVFVTDRAIAAPQSILREVVSQDTQAAPTDKQCRKVFGVPCYSPQEMRTAYGMNGLIDSGNVGAGQTIVIIDSYGSPTIAADLKVFDAGYGIPDPPSFKILSPLGTVPWNPKRYPDQPGWAAETTLDVEWAHSLAPGASIILLTSPVDETEGVQGLPEFLALERYALDHHLGKIISQSWGATENTLFAGAAGPQGPQVIADFTQFYERAALAQVTVIAAAGDDGSSNPNTTGGFYPFPTVGFPASSPWVMAVGGTTLFASTSGKYQSETVWSNAQCCAGGGGISQLFKEPGYQTLALTNAVDKRLGGMRGVPDVSYNADCFNSILVYLSYLGASSAGYYGICGTSEGSPQWAGIVADLNQFVGRPLGFLNPTIYAVAGLGDFGSIGRDITKGNNALLQVPGATAPGYSAKTGWDPATGWGSPNFADLPFQPFTLIGH
jgi:subtilase family serine protease